MPNGVVVFVDAEKNQGGKVLRTYDPNQTGYEEIDVGVILFHPHLRRQPPPRREEPKQQENQCESPLVFVVYRGDKPLGS